MEYRKFAYRTQSEKEEGKRGIRKYFQYKSGKRDIEIKWKDEYCDYFKCRVLTGYLLSGV